VASSSLTAPSATPNFSFAFSIIPFFPARRAGAAPARFAGRRWCRFSARIFQREVEIVDEEADVAVSHRNLKLLRELFLHHRKIVAGGDPAGDGLFLLRRESHDEG